MVWASVPRSGAGISRWGSEHLRKAARPATNELLFLQRRKLRGIYRDTAFCAAEGNIEERRLLCHQTGECTDVVEVDVLMEPNPTLSRATST